MTRREPATTSGAEPKTTEVGSVFVSNYPPYSFWSDERIEAVHARLEQPPEPATPLGLYLHIPFCRKRCKFCYFRVYTDKNASDVERYIDAVSRETEIYAARPVLQGRPLKFVYFGGGTPSFISGRQLRRLVERFKGAIPWDGVEEVTFECEPGTLTERKLETIREIGVTRLSLGVENFDDRILEENGRAHVSKEIYRVAPWIKSLDFDQLNVDLIAGMVGETWDTWKETVDRTVEMDADSVTIYQMELPFNTVYSQRVMDGDAVPVADWATKRDWHEHAIERLEESGYEISSAYTMVKRDSPARFVYRDSVWHGCDLLGVGVSSFSHLGGVHFQNTSRWDHFLAELDTERLPIERAFVPSAEERLTREMILQLKLGRLRQAYFRDKFQVDILGRFRSVFDKLDEAGMLVLDGDEIRLTRRGLLRADSLLPEFYASQYQNSRYT